MSSKDTYHHGDLKATILSEAAALAVSARRSHLETLKRSEMMSISISKWTLWQPSQERRGADTARN